MSTTTPQNHDVDPTASTNAAVPADRSDERLVARRSGIGGTVAEAWDRIRSGDLGSLPVVVGLVIIWAVFGSLLLLVAIYFVGAEQGATSLIPGMYVHEFLHDGRHLLNADAAAGDERQDCSCAGQRGRGGQCAVGDRSDSGQPIRDD